MEQTKVPIPANVLEGLEAVRLSGMTNMLDAPRVIELALEMGHAEAAFWVHENRRKYAEGIFRGFATPESKAEVVASPDKRRPSRHVAQHGASHRNGGEPSQAHAPQDTCEGGEC